MCKIPFLVECVRVRVSMHAISTKATRLSRFLSAPSLAPVNQTPLSLLPFFPPLLPPLPRCRSLKVVRPRLARWPCSRGTAAAECQLIETFNWCITVASLFFTHYLAHYGWSSLTVLTSLVQTPLSPTRSRWFLLDWFEAVACCVRSLLHSPSFTTIRIRPATFMRRCQATYNMRST